MLIAPGSGISQQRTTRSLIGVVTDKRGNVLKGAAVELENNRSLEIISYLTRVDGHYYFHQLSDDTDFTVKAKYKQWWSKPRLLNKLNTDKIVTINLEIPID